MFARRLCSGYNDVSVMLYATPLSPELTILRISAVFSFANILIFAFPRLFVKFLCQSLCLLAHSPRSTSKYSLTNISIVFLSELPHRQRANLLRYRAQDRALIRFERVQPLIEFTSQFGHTLGYWKVGQYVAIGTRDYQYLQNPGY